MALAKAARLVEETKYNLGESALTALPALEEFVTAQGIFLLLETTNVFPPPSLQERDTEYICSGTGDLLT
jgi:hypothetical protein